MRAVRLDAFSARLHAIHLKGAKAAPKPALKDESASEGATTGMPVREDDVRRLLGDDENEALDDVRRVFGDDGDAADDDDEPPGAGHFASNTPRGYHEPERPRDAPRRRAQDEDIQDQIREIQRRLSDIEAKVSYHTTELERDVGELKAQHVARGNHLQHIEDEIVTLAGRIGGA